VAGECIHAVVVVGTHTVWHRTHHLASFHVFMKHNAGALAKDDHVAAALEEVDMDPERTFEWWCRLCNSTRRKWMAFREATMMNQGLRGRRTQGWLSESG
jgi:hypothetical protein